MVGTGLIDNLTPWQPGQSGNPSGKPKGRNRKSIVQEAIEAIIEGKTQQVVDAMTAAQIAKALEGDTTAFKELMDSAYGKNADNHNIGGASEGQTEFKIEVVKK